MGDNVIHITDLGLRAANNAKKGGVLINVVTFKLGDSSEQTRDTDEDIRGETLYKGSIYLIEVLDTHAVRFTFELPDHAIPEDGLYIREVGLFMDDNLMFGRCVFEQPYFLHEKRGARLHAVLVTTRVDPGVINVNMGELASLPSTPSVDRLPDPETGYCNTLAVLNMIDNSDGTTSPGYAIRYGPGSLLWGFCGFDRVFSGNPDAGATGEEFRVEALTAAMRFRNGEVVIAHVISGPARGASRKFYYVMGTDSFVDKDGVPVAGLDEGGVIAIWRRIEGSTNGGAEYPPKMAGVPPDWVLTRGVGNLPVWAPPRNTGQNMNTLYVSPGKLRISTLNDVGTGQSHRYSLGNVVLKDVNHCITALGGVTQHKSAYDVTGSELEFADSIPPHASIDARLITKEPGSGTYTEIVTDSYIGDGEKRRFKLSEPVESSEYVFSYIRGLLQATTSYTYDPSTQEIVFVSPPSEGLSIEFSSLVLRQEEGYSTTVLSTTVITVGDTLFVELPVEPQSKDHTFVSISGTHIHRDLYTVVDNKVVLSSAARGGLEIEVVVFHNILSDGTPQSNLKGVVTDAVLTSKSLKLLRHDTHPVVLPIPTVDLVAGNGIKVSGQHPVYKIESTLAQQFNETTNFKVSTLRRQEDSEEIIYTYRVNLTSDLMLQVSVDFSAVLGPGFISPDGMELMQYVIGFRTTSSREPDYGRDIKGTGEAGFSSLSGNTNERAFSNASLTQVFDVVRDNIPAGYIDIVARMRVRHANISKYGSKLGMNFNIIGSPLIK
tara:strand:+ start:44419 stop:46740 length:2322 start_codon:yes stop_codon:yes gene_type:complete